MANRKSPLPTLAEFPRVGWLVFDISNLLHRTFYAKQQEINSASDIGLAFHVALTVLNRYYRHFKPRYGVVMCFDRPSWRKAWMAAPGRISTKPYKGTRRKDMTPKQVMMYQAFMEHIQQFERVMVDHTAVVTLAEEGLEADDLIAEFCRQRSGAKHTTVVVSADTDLLQLQSYPNVVNIDPSTNQPISLAGEFFSDPEYYVFVKTIRGDTSDNIQSALPRVRITKIREAYQEEYAYTQLMKTTWTDQTGQTIMVEDAFTENTRLINLRAQPKVIRQLMSDTIVAATERKYGFSMMHFLRFLKKQELLNIKTTIGEFLPMLGTTPIFVS